MFSCTNNIWWNQRISVHFARSTIIITNYYYLSRSPEIWIFYLGISHRIISVCVRIRNMHIACNFHTFIWIWVLSTLNISSVFFVAILSYIFVIAEKPLNDYISYYETLNYDETRTHASHNRAKRSVTKDPYVFLKFRAHNRPFHIRLKRDLVTFSDNLVVSRCFHFIPCYKMYIVYTIIFNWRTSDTTKTHIFTVRCRGLYALFMRRTLSCLLPIHMCVSI